jgi:DNA-binding response OmpR family regulator
MPIVGKRVLIVEDEFLLALTLEEDLKAAGGIVVGPFTTLADALAAIESESFDAAVLDINLRGEMSYAAADALLEKGMPLLFLSGYSAASLPEQFRNIRRLTKPYASVQLIEALDAIITEHSGRTAGPGGAGIPSTWPSVRGKTD